MNYFELFGLPVAPSVDRSLLARMYFELQRKNHPDFFTQANEMEQEDALKLSADINKAFAIFKHPDRTLHYFLTTTGLIEDDEKYALPPDFLMDMMEINELLEEEGEPEARMRISAFEKELDDSVKEIMLYYNEKGTGKEDLLMLKDYYYKKKYLNRILDRLAD